VLEETSGCLVCVELSVCHSLQTGWRKQVQAVGLNAAACCSHKRVCHKHGLCEQGDRDDRSHTDEQQLHPRAGNVRPLLTEVSECGAWRVRVRISVSVLICVMLFSNNVQTNSNHAGSRRGTHAIRTGDWARHAEWRLQGQAVMLSFLSEFVR
jgi:hypothetical protein